MGKKEQIGLRIRTMRKSRRMTQEDLAKAISQSTSSITMYETGRRSPDYETLEAFADIFNVPISALVSDDSSIDLEVPKTPEARAVSFGMDQLPQEQREMILNMVRAMFPNNKFTEGDENDR